MKTTHLFILCVVTLSVGRIPVAADQWPQWRGPNRDGISAETGLLSSWPTNGPALVWTIDGIGSGHSSPIVVGGKLFITGHHEGVQHVYCFSDDGKKQWESQNGAPLKVRYGAQGSVTVDGSRLYVLNEGGRLAAFETTTGEEKWHRSMLELGGRAPRYRYAESPLVHGDKIFCQAGGAEASVVGLDKLSGQVLWKSSGLEDGAAYCSPIVATFGGREQLLTVTQIGLVGLDVKTGKLLWRYDAPFKDGRSCITPIVWRDHVFAEAGRKARAVILKVGGNEGPFTPTPIWEAENVPPSHLSGSVGLDGKAYGESGYGWGCRDLETGKDLYRTKDIASGATIYADGHFYVQSTRGDVFLVRADEKSCHIVSQFRIPEPALTWATPALSEGRLYIRCEDKVHVYRVCLP